MRSTRPRRRFPGYDVLSQRGRWDGKTRAVVMARLRPSGPASFFTAAEEPVCRALCALLLALEGSPAEPPVFELIDGRLAAGATDGWRYDDMPEDAHAWRRSLAELSRRRWLALLDADRRRLLESIAGGERFAGMPGKRLFELWMRYACGAFYSHPFAWNEIGFGGPAYPRGYKSMGLDRREPWEVKDAAPRDPVAAVARRKHAHSADDEARPAV